MDIYEKINVLRNTLDQIELIEIVNRLRDGARYNEEQGLKALARTANQLANMFRIAYQINELEEFKKQQH